MQQMNRDSELCRQSYDRFSVLYLAHRFLLFEPKIDGETRGCVLVFRFCVFLSKHLNIDEIRLKCLKEK